MARRYLKESSARRCAKRRDPEAIQRQPGFYQAGLSESVDAGQLFADDELMDGLGSFVGYNAFEV